MVLTLYLFYNWLSQNGKLKFSFSSEATVVNKPTKSFFNIYFSLFFVCITIGQCRGSNVCEREGGGIRKGPRVGIRTWLTAH